MNLIMTLFEIRSLPRLTIANRKDDRFAYVEDCLIPYGPHKPIKFDENAFILTPSVKKML